MSEEIKEYSYKGEKLDLVLGEYVWKWGHNDRGRLLSHIEAEELCADGVLQEIKPPEPEFEDIERAVKTALAGEERRIKEREHEDAQPQPVADTSKCTRKGFIKTAWI